MKIAAVTNDGRSISAHFGRARGYVVLTVEDGVVVEREMRDKSACNHGHHGHGHGHDHDHDHDHDHHDHSSAEQAIDLTPPGTAQPVDNHSNAATIIADCEIVLSRGMGQGMHNNLQRAGVRAVMTNMVLIDDAVKAYLAGNLKEYPELVH